jgi:hypothetical protein
LTAITEELFESLSTLSPPLVYSLIATTSPKLALAISQPLTDETIHLPSEAIQLANSLIRARGGPLEGELVESVTRAVLLCLKETDDMDVVQVGVLSSLALSRVLMR